MTDTGSFDHLINAVESRQARVGIIGLGYVGLPLTLAFVHGGFPVVGFDIDRRKVEQLNAGQSYLRQISGTRIAELLSTRRFEATIDFDRLREMDVIIICVPTPLTPQRAPDMDFIEKTAREIAQRLRREQLIVLESTTYPGTTNEIVRPILEQTGLRSSRDFLLAYSPEREDPGNVDFETRTIPKVVGGGDPVARQIAVSLYQKVITQVVPVSTLETAEAVKITENIFRAVNIALVNELKMVFDRMGLDVWEVIDAAKTKPFGYMPFYPGPGLGGHCIPIDPFYLTWKAREFDVSTRFIELAGEINTLMPNYVVEKLSAALNDRFGKALKGSHILLIGVAYKKNVEDCRESPALKLFELIEHRGATVDYYDPFVYALPEMRRYPSFNLRRSIEWDRNALSSYDAAVICTDHDSVNYGELAEVSRLIVDTRNATREITDTAARSKIVKA
jgi:UDP-N-acetyl-D-glucosamine dehydrogenase